MCASNIEDRFTENAEQFDALVVELLSSDAKLRKAATSHTKMLRDFINAGLITVAGDDCAATLIAKSLEDLDKAAAS